MNSATIVTSFFLGCVIGFLSNDSSLKEGRGEDAVTTSPNTLERRSSKSLTAGVLEVLKEADTERTDAFYLDQTPQISVRESGFINKPEDPKSVKKKLLGDGQPMPGAAQLLSPDDVIPRVKDPMSATSIGNPNMSLEETFQNRTTAASTKISIGDPSLTPETVHFAVRAGATE